MKRMRRVRTFSRTLEAFEHTIAVLDGSEEFLEAVHSEASEEEATAEDAEFERF